MKRMYLLLVLAVLTGIIEVFVFYPIIPEHMAVHFNASGIADGWGSKNHFIKSTGILYALLTLLFAAMPLLFRILPDSLINLPNKSYWLALERRNETFDRMAGQIVFIGAMALFLQNGIFYLVCRANYSPIPALNPGLIWGITGVFLAITAGWLIFMIRSFRRPAT